jgi:beta-glucosidase
VTRRRLAEVSLGFGMAGLAATNPAAADAPGPERQFPAGFRWGVATSAYQIEGANRTDGRGACIWDTFCAQPGKIRDGSDGAVACDHYHRYREDVALMKAMGVTAYRFSIGWPRLFPDGTGKPNAQGVAFYDRLVDELLAHGIEPFPTLYHWDLPQALQDRGGWQARDTALAFADYAAAVAARLGDRASRFFTLNEILTFLEQGYGTGRFAPGLVLPRAELNQARHHAVLAHGLSVQAMRAAASRPIEIGPAENMTTALPAVETADNVRAAERATRDMNAPYLTVMMEGRYTDAWLAEQGADAPRFTAAELAAIASPVDFVGLNIYTPGAFVQAADTAPGYVVLPMPDSYPRMASTWLTFGPETLYWAPRHVAKLWDAKAVYITENGTSAADQPALDGTVYDVDRVMFLRQYLTQLRRATAEGVPVRGYFAWSLLDNFEWADGYATRFGLCHVDYRTQKRTPKLSAAFYRNLIARNALA